MRIKHIIEDKHDEIMQIAAKHGATRIRLFGSAARDEAGEDSDMDVLLTMRQGSSLLDIIAIKQDLEELLGISVDVVTEASISPYIRDAILKEAVNL